jgi:hypothetical protein
MQLDGTASDRRLPDSRSRQVILLFWFWGQKAAGRSGGVGPACYGTNVHISFEPQTGPSIVCTSARRRLDRFVRASPARAEVLFGGKYWVGRVNRVYWDDRPAIDAGRQGGRTAGPPANTGGRAAGRYELPGGRAAGRYELPLGWNGLLPLVADLWEKLHDL